MCITVTDYILESTHAKWLPQPTDLGNNDSYNLVIFTESELKLVVGVA